VILSYKKKYFFYNLICFIFGKNNLEICVDSKDCRERHPYNLEEKSKWELIQIIQKLSKQINE